jgi:hypothetical protein
MSFEVKTIPLSRLIISSQGLIEPLCNSCARADCPLNIIDCPVSVVGINKKFKLLEKNGDKLMVYKCDGYKPKKQYSH